MGPGAGLGWLKNAINLGRHNAKAVFGAVALMALVALVPSLVQLLLQQGLGVGPQSMLMVAGLLTLAMIVVYPLLVGGMLRVIHASENGQPTHATALFDTFRAGNGAGRLIGFGVLLTAIYITVFLAVIMAVGKDFLSWYMQVINLSLQAGDPSQLPALPALPEGFGTLMALGTLVGLFFGGIYAIGFGQITLAGRTIGEALADGVGGTLKNLLPLLVLAVVVFVAMIVLMIVVALVGGLLMLIGGLVHQSLALLLLAPVYLGMLLVMYVVMFGVMYFMWRDVCGDPPPTADADHVEA
ncbi:hypothetical protein GCM10023332_05020 [Luteimonas vadosa]|uniref:Uncharacterized protein n=2 Tax=Luteimonas vadosa TaxID=1165507 RepID=A0ABP9DX93_9GAMM